MPNIIVNTACVFVLYRRRLENMAVIETGRTCRRNGMANIFADIDAADIEYLSSLTASESTASVPNLTGAHALQISFEDPSLNTDDSGNHQSDDNNDEDSTDCR